VLALLCEPRLGAKNAVFGQSGPRVGSFDGGFGASFWAAWLGQAARAPGDLVPAASLQAEEALAKGSWF